MRSCNFSPTPATAPPHAGGDGRRRLYSDGPGWWLLLRLLSSVGTRLPSGHRGGFHPQVLQGNSCPFSLPHPRSPCPPLPSQARFERLLGQAFNSDYLMTYQGHYMSVYTVRWNYFHPRLFASCSADWTVKLWDQDIRAAIMSFDLNVQVSRSDASTLLTHIYPQT